MPRTELIFIERLKREQMGCLQLLETPKDKSEFGYGEACGTLAGLRRAEQLFTEMLEEEDDRT